MPLLTLTNATDLAQWADRRDAQEELPHIIRRLIQATGVEIGLRRLNFRTGEGVQLAGWDGIVETDKGTTYIPQGSSRWEAGASSDPSGKANGDYSNRSANPDGVDPAKTTFVFVTPRRWSGKDAWAAERRKEGTWADVRVLDADDLEAWLQTAGAVHVWLSRLMGKHPDGVIDLETYWLDWSSATAPAITAALVLAGREEYAQKTVVPFVSSPRGVLRIRCDSREEAAALLAAGVLGLPEPERTMALARTVLVLTESAWDEIIASPSPLLLVPLFGPSGGIPAALRRGHSLVLPLGIGDGGDAEEEDVAPRLSRDRAKQALTAAGVSEDKAEELAGVARRSLAAFRRRASSVGTYTRPEWAQPSQARDIIPLLLLGAWNGAVEGDRAVVATLAQRSYDDVAQTMTRWALTTDPPVRRNGDVWLAASRHDLWDLVSRQATAADLERFQEVALAVLAQMDPRFELAEEQRWMAGALGHSPKHSGYLREGVAGTLALMGVHGDIVPSTAGLAARDRATILIRELFERANQDWRVWASLAHELPQLAEAAPEPFLRAVEAGSAGDSPVLVQVFTDKTDSFFSSSPHTGLLWSLETLAWSPPLLPRASLALARLASVDPGGRLSNRPAASLREIFVGWHPQTTALLAERVQVLDLIRTRHPTVSWKLMIALLPEAHAVAMHTASPRWRDWRPDEYVAPTVGEYLSFVNLVVERLLADVGLRGERWKELIESLDTLPEESFEAIRERLTALATTAIPSHDRDLIWNALRTIVARHRSFPDATWAMPPDVVDRLDVLRSQFVPDNVVARYSWLFSNRPELPEGRLGDDWASREEALSRERESAVGAIFGSDGVAGAQTLALAAEQPFIVGFTLGRAQVPIQDLVSLLGQHLGGSDPKLVRFAMGVVSGLFAKNGWPWAKGDATALAKMWSPIASANFAAALPHSPDAWSIVESFGPEAEAHYWSVKPPYGLDDATTAVHAAEKYVSQKQAIGAIAVLGTYHTKGQGVPTALIFTALEGALQELTPGHTLDQMFGYHVSELMEALAGAKGVDEGRLAKLEWAYLPLLGQHDRQPRILHRELEGTPSFFVEVLRMLYHAEGAEQETLTPQDRARYRAAHDLLDSWKGFPGQHTPTGSDAISLRTWVDEARQLASATGHQRGCDYEVGRILSRTTPDSDGRWPNATVCALIDELASDRLDSGFRTAIYNSRGVVTKSTSEGGTQERQLAKHYEALAAPLRMAFPRTASLLDGLAQSYHHDAQREDSSVELREDLHD